jgi:uncharacterized damage-inducible protein DinB
MSHSAAQMSFADEVEDELSLCRQIFERLPTQILSWKPHEKSPTTGGLAAHIADMVEWIGLAATTDELDYAVRPLESFEPTTTDELLRYFDARAKGVPEAIDKLDDEGLRRIWTIRNGQRIFIARPREQIIRVDCLSHIIHHRGQLTVYCRLKDIALPGVYGPNGEE